MFRILIVEDDTELCQLFSHVLEKNGYHTRMVSNGQEALDALAEEYVDLIISDIMMPVMDGYELVRSLRKKSVMTPVLMITARDAFDDMRLGFLSGTDDYMVKPINVSEMVLRVGALLIATLLTALLENLLHEAIEVHPLVWLLLFGTTIGLTAATVVNVLLLRPVVRLSRAMKQVASGNFSVRLTTNSVINEIADSYDSFNRMVEALGETETLQTDFVSNVSHEIKTPVSAIEGYTTLLQSTDVSPEQAGYIERILLNTRRLSTLVGNILLLSKVSNHTMPMKQTCYRLDEQIRQAIVLLEAQWSPKQLDFDADLAEVTWRGPETLMLHVWTNLLSNAVKFSPQHGLIAVTLKQTDGRFEIAITDQGPGIPPEEQERIYRRFYQVDSSHQQEGNGLGLALCKQILDDCGGTIRVKNQSPCGCRFIVTLPEKIAGEEAKQEEAHGTGK